MNKIRKWFLCSILGFHEWTSQATQGVSAKFNSFEGFLEYSKSYCSRCGKINRFSQMEKERWDQEQVREKIRKLKEL